MTTLILWVAAIAFAVWAILSILRQEILFSGATIGPRDTEEETLFVSDSKLEPMNTDYMIFYRESDLQHYLYNGKFPIAINPDEDERDPWPANRSSLPVGKATLDAALQAHRTRSFVIVPQRYKCRIIQRGKFVSE